ncbi:class I SAM-dependent methyltransferase [Rhodopseudomonas palustris]|uniref:class I SAM-dependent methyltransferase n=1 Tax=Rhodopseudomonas palustris TaxID=1076 RepID=UPI002ACE5A47|nr:class I SAM-dependent methyltransferase [Rhodopseudomonas palustris]WQH00180.1 class I SAM-dependent methyltransferase [Rhodopseudomonas palustris]
MSSASTYEDYLRHSDEVAGWVEPGFFKTLLQVEDMVRAHGVTGSVAEIGVHCGKFLLAMALASGDRPAVVAVDNFENGPEIRASLERHVARFYDPDRVTIVESDSMQLSSADLLAKLPSRAKYFSVDGYHRAEFVINDLMVAQDVICDGGVVIVDDYLSPLVGVTEGVTRFLLQNAHQKIAPFAYGENKLLMTTIIKRRAYFNHFRKLHPKLVSKIGGYLCAGINPDDKWFKTGWTSSAS